MKRYFKEIDGTTVYKTAKQIVIEKDGFNIYNPSEEMILEDGWAEYIYIIPMETIEECKKEKIEHITHYDSSPIINEFYIQGIPVWLDKNTRVGLSLRFESEIMRGKKETVLWYENKQFPLPLNMAKNMLYIIEEYASKCYDNTQKHIANVNKLETIEEIKDYDFTTGYPEKLHFR